MQDKPPAAHTPATERLHFIALVILTGGLVALLLFGKADARYFTYGQFTRQWIPVRTIGKLFFDNIPPMPHPIVYGNLVGAATGILLVTVIIGLAMFLLPGWFESVDETDDSLQALAETDDPADRVTAP